MNDLIQFIVGDADVFTPASVVGLIVFSCIFDGICLLVATLLGSVRR